MNIAIASHGLFPLHIGGMERHTFELAKALQALGADVIVLAPQSDKSADFPFAVEFLPWPKTATWLWSNYKFSQYVKTWLSQSNADICLSQGFAAWSAMGKGIRPMFFHPHGLEMYGEHLTLKEKCKLWPFRKLVAYHARHADQVISLGGKLSDILLQRVAVEPKKLWEMANGVDAQKFSASYERKGKRKLLFVGRFAFNKGIDMLPAIMNSLLGEDFELSMVGGGPLQGEVEGLAMSDSRVTYCKNVDDEQLMGLYQNCDALLFCSRFEGMPTVILEAMASGAVPIATRIGAVEAIFSQELGFLSQPTVAGIAASIKNFLRLSDQELMQRKKLCRERIEQSFTWQALAKQFLQRCQWVLQG